MVSDISPLAELRLTYLSLMECAQLKTIGALATVTTLQTLYLDGTAIPDLEPLAGLSRLETLSISRCAEVDSIAPLRAMPNLRRVWLDNTRPGLDLSPLAGKNLTIHLAEGQEVRGVNDLGPRVKIEWPETAR
jgi:Leucine-rich repeat (LRR) protein